MKGKVKELERNSKAKAEELEGLKSEETRQNQEMLSYRDNITHLVLTIHRLVEQKILLAKMLASREQQCRDSERNWQGVVTK